MDDKWNVVVEGTWAHFERSWTSIRIYSVRFESSSEGWSIAEAWVNSDPCAYHPQPPRVETRMVDWLIKAIVLGHWSEHLFPNPPGPPDAPDAAFWVEPGWVMAGRYPGDTDIRAARRRLIRLYTAGTRHLIDLTVHNERTSKGVLLSYREIAEKVGFSYRRLAVQPGTMPGQHLLEDITDEIAQAVAAGRPVYIHDVSGRGRAALVAGLWLTEAGIAESGEVLMKLEQLTGIKRSGIPNVRRYRDFLAAGGAKS